MTNYFALAGLWFGGALIGASITALVSLAKIGRYRRAFGDLYNEHWQAKARINRALEVIPPYTRGSNGAVQRIGKILRGERL